MKKITKHYINGQFVESTGTELFDLINPSNQKVIGQVKLGTVQDTKDAIAAAKEAFKTFSKTTLSERAQYLQQLHDAVSANETEHMNIMIEEYGGTHNVSKNSSKRAAHSFLLAKQNLEKIEFTKKIGAAEVQLEAVGVVGLITPWNASTSFVCSKIAAAIAAGCTVVVKPSEMSALQTEAVLVSFAKAGLPPGVINVVNGRGDVVGAEITRSVDIAKISFTGSTLVGKTIARDGAATLKRITLELGGKSPHIILDDANLEKAVNYALAVGTMNSGQACIAGTRILVPENKLAEVKKIILESISKFKVGLPSDPSTMIGPMVSRKQYERVQSYIQKGIDEGAELLTGGLGHPEGLEGGNFVKPTVFINVKNDMVIAQEEIFGPVLAVITYKTEQEAVEIANDTTYGLHGYVSTSNKERGLKIANQIVAGRVMVNEFFDEPNAPFGGFKQSGIGREFGTYGIEAYLETKAVFA